MTKLATVFEAFLGIILTLSLLTFGWAYIDGMHTLDATPLSQITGQDVVVSESVLNAPVEPVEAPQSDVPVIVVDDNAEPEPESMTFVSSYTPPQRRRSNHRSRKTAGVDQALADNGEARVIVSFSEPSNKGNVVNTLESMGAQKHTEWSDGVAVTASSVAIAAIENDDSVDLIEEDLPLQTMTYEGFDLIDLEKVLSSNILTLDDATVPNSKNLTATGSLSLTGATQTVAIIDSGLYSNHPEFSGKVLDEWDFYENDDEAQDSWNHGTRMAGIIAAKGVYMDGVAPDANIVNLRITNSTGGSQISDLNEALDWVINNASKYNITSVYIGVGNSLYTGTEPICVSFSTATKINIIISKNITVVAPAGHDSNTTMIAFPACVANTISVGGVPDGGVYPADTWDLNAGGVQSNRRDGLLDLLAPGGDGFTKTTQDDISDDYISGTGVGTSVAAAYVAGASILLREYWDARDWDFRPAGLVNGNIPNTIEYIFKQTGKQIEDVNNSGVYYPRLDFFKAVNYEENKPVVSLETANESTVAPGTITLEYNVTDQHDITSCSLYINGVLNQTNNSITRDITQSFSVDLGEAVYTWKVECNDTATFSNTGVSGTNKIIVITIDSEVPQYSSLSATPNTYAPSQTYTIEATWTDNVAVDQVILEFDGVNYTDAVKAGNVYTKTFTDLAAGTYNYVWHANDTSDNWNDTGVQVFTINKASTNLNWNTTPGWSVTSGTPTTVQCISDNAQSVMKLYRDGVEVSNPDVQTLAVNTYDYVCNTTGSQNYTSDEITKTLTVTNKNPSTATLVFDKVSPQTYGATIMATCTDTNPEAGAKLYRDGVDVTSENGTNVTLAAGTYSYVCNVSETANYSFAEDTDSFTIDQAPSVVELKLNGSHQNITVYVGENVDYLGTLIAGEGNISLYIDGILDHTAPSPTMGGIMYASPIVSNVTLVYDGNENYTSISDALIVTVLAVNQPPVISGIPDQVIDEDASTVIIFDLYPYAVDPDGNVSNGVFSLDSESNPSLIDCLILHNSTSDYAVCLQPEANQTGYSDVTIMFTDEGGASDNDTFRVTVNPVDDPTYWLPLSNQAIDEDSADGTVAYANLGNQCIDIDSIVGIINVTSAHSHYDLVFSGNNLIVNNLEADWFGTETVDLDCNGLSNSFDLTVNDVPVQQTCYTACTYGNCWTYCE